jgi:hypothetical protein
MELVLTKNAHNQVVVACHARLSHAFPYWNALRSLLGRITFQQGKDSVPIRKLPHRLLSDALSSSKGRAAGFDTAKYAYSTAAACIETNNSNHCQKVWFRHLHS